MIEDCKREVLDLVYGRFCCYKHQREVEQGIQEIISNHIKVKNEN